MLIRKLTPEDQNSAFIKMVRIFQESRNQNPVKSNREESSNSENTPCNRTDCTKICESRDNEAKV